MRKAPEYLTCTICYDAPDKRIYQCVNGHLVCEECDSKLSDRACPVCRDAYNFGTFKRIRNRSAEQSIASLLTTCNECNEEMTRGELALHMPCKLFSDRLVEKRFGNRVEKYCGLQGREECTEVAFNCGETHCYENGQHVRTEFRSPHENDGMKVFYEDNKLKRKEFHSPHRRDGCKKFYKDDDLVRIEYHSPHECAGMKKYYKNNTLRCVRRKGILTIL
jgi:hypothetical protein